MKRPRQTALTPEFSYWPHGLCIYGVGKRKGLISTVKSGHSGLKLGAINSKNEIVIPAKYATMSITKDSDLISVGLLNENKELRYGFIDLKGNQVIPFIYEEASDFNKNGRARVRFPGERKSVLIDKKGNIVR